MAIRKRDEARALDADELTLVEKSHHPVLQDLSDDELSKLVVLVRERRDRARSMADQRRREIRGKGKARGMTPSKSDEGSRQKLEVLAMAMRRLNSEVERRRRMAARATLVANANQALALKQASAQGDTKFNTRHAHQGMRAVANQRRQDLVRPMELGRQRKAAAVAQAKRDGR
ncbi:MAG: hypothetical protein U1E62_12390 [Alsobacter sp.]